MYIQYFTFLQIEEYAAIHSMLAAFKTLQISTYFEPLSFLHKSKKTFFLNTPHQTSRKLVSHTSHIWIQNDVFGDDGITWVELKFPNYFKIPTVAELTVQRASHSKTGGARKYCQGRHFITAFCLTPLSRFSASIFPKRSRNFNISCKRCQNYYPKLCCFVRTG